MLPRAYPQVPLRAKVAVAPWVVLLVVVLGVLDDRGVIDLGGGPAAAPHHRPARRPAASVAPGGGAEVPPAYLAAYRHAARTCPHLSWALLAAVGKVESNHGRGWPPRWRSTPGIAYGTENFAGAGGPMQFLAPTWARWGRGGDRWDYRDAVPAAARKLCADGVARGDLSAALFAYNPSRRYVAGVLDVARRYQAGGGR
ncbi:MAG TPA: hypothetical protein VGM21_11190 [Actinomycetota bacterium]|jgi:hypothetical protein